MTGIRSFLVLYNIWWIKLGRWVLLEQFGSANESWKNEKDGKRSGQLRRSVAELAETQAELVQVLSRIKIKIIDLNQTRIRTTIHLNYTRIMITIDFTCTRITITIDFNSTRMTNYKNKIQFVEAVIQRVHWLFLFSLVVPKYIFFVL
jgi:hypothetical protein